MSAELSQRIITFTEAELEAFAEAVAQRTVAHAIAVPKLEARVIRTGKLVVDVLAFEASVAGEALSLKTQEYRLLKVLAQHLGQVLTREQLLTLAWPAAEEVLSDRSVDVHIRRLRVALKTEAHLIATVHKHGYKLIRSSD